MKPRGRAASRARRPEIDGNVSSHRHRSASHRRRACDEHRFARGDVRILTLLAVSW
ncbi:hypothetical protein A7982_12897 [Minicystis rosea]|nr:hypothetical protein A7982_12897 [Minicystis rosea]